MLFVTQGKTNLKYILVVVVLAAIVGGGILAWVWINRFEEKPLSICGSSGKAFWIDVKNCNKSCQINEDCRFTCGCGAINKNEICHKEEVIYDCVDRDVKCENNVCVAGEEKTADETADWKTYRNDEYELYGYEIKYPVDWHVDESNAGFGDIYFRNVSKEEYENIRREGKMNNIQEIVIQYKTEYSSVDEWAEGEKLSLYHGLGITEEDIEKIVSIKEITIGTEKGYKMAFIEGWLGPSGTALFKGEKGYLLIYQFLPEECRSGECQLFTQMLSTFKFLE